MNRYEIMYIVKPYDEDAFKATVEKFNALLINNGADITRTDICGKKRLAYQIEDLTEGIYVLVTFKAEPKAIKELDRVMLITDNILRHIIIRKEV